MPSPVESPSSARAERVERAAVEGGIGLQVRDRGVDDVGGDGRVAGDAVHRDAAELLDERLLARDAVEVASGARVLPLPRRGVQVLQVTRAYVRQRRRSVEPVAARPPHVEAGELVTCRGREVHGHGPDRVDELLERLEVDLEVVVEVETEVRAQGVDDRLGPVVERGVDLRVPEPGNLHPQVARERHRVAPVTVGMEHHQRVRTGRRALGRVVAERVELPLVLDERPRVRAHDDEVDGVTALRGDGHVDPRDVVDLPVDVTVDHEHATSHHDDTESGGDGDACREVAERDTEGMHGPAMVLTRLPPAVARGTPSNPYARRVP